MQRDDLLHPAISGNKWRKLKGWLQLAGQGGYDGVVTYGGAFSNHLVATAAAARMAGLPCLGVLRGEEEMQNPRLQYCQAQGMLLRGVSRQLYRDKAAALSAVDVPFQKPLVIPEGGSGAPGWVGFQDLVAEWQQHGFQPAAVVHASATGTTAAGLAKALRHAACPTQVHAVLVLRNLEEQQALADAESIHWHCGWEQGGYAKVPAVLLEFTEALSLANDVPLEPIYTGKTLWAVNEMLRSGELSAEGLCFLHTGGVFPSPCGSGESQHLQQSGD
jgi:1-aminocyclopropane-1-carboxylate deaminase